MKNVTVACVGLYRVWVRGGDAQDKRSCDTAHDWPVRFGFDVFQTYC